MAPVVALAEPKKLFGLGQKAPVDAAIAALEKGGYLLFEYVANLAGGGIGDAQRGDFVIARSGDEGQPRALLVPLHVAPFAAAAGEVIAECGAVLVGRHLEAHDAGAIEIDGDSLDGGHDRVAGQRVFPGLQGGMAYLGLHEEHFTHAALVLLKGGDAFGIGRPLEDGPVAGGPPGVVGGVSKILDAVGS